MDQVIEVIRNNVRKNSEEIRAIKDEALKSPLRHICPAHKCYAEYRGRKHETTKWLIALHQAKGNHHKIKYHLYGKRSDGDPLSQPKEALKALQELQEKVQRGTLVSV
jgi:hypothetical protein